MTLYVKDPTSIPHDLGHRPGLAPATVRKLDEGCFDDLTSSTTPEERIEMVAILSRCMWERTGRPIPTYARHETPVRVVRRP